MAGCACEFVDDDERRDGSSEAQKQNLPFASTTATVVEDDGIYRDAS